VEIARLRRDHDAEITQLLHEQQSLKGKSDKEYGQLKLKLVADLEIFLTMSEVLLALPLASCRFFYNSLTIV
jgi:hypothetical protein